MKRIMTIVALAVVSAMSACALSLVEASGKVDAAIASESVMAEVIKGLSPAEQATFLSRVNAAIDAMPGSPAEKTAAYLQANKSAIKAGNGNRLALLAETFATVPPEALTVINERFAGELFSRNANPAQPIDDTRMTNIAVTAFRQIKERDAAADDSDVRNTFAILMLLRASEGSPADLSKILVSELDSPEVREVAASEWIPAAMGQGQPKSYDPLLGAVSGGGSSGDFAEGDGGDVGEYDILINASPAEAPVALLADLCGPFGDTAMLMAVQGGGYSALPPSEIGNIAGIYRVPRSADSSDAWYGGSRRGDDRDEGGSGGRNCRVICEPGGYNCQIICD